MIQAITFDFWDTLAIDDSDEPKRARLGLPKKNEAREQLFAHHITSTHPDIAWERAIEAYRWSNERFRADWHQDQRTPGVTTRLYYAFEHLGLAPKPGQYSRLVHEVDVLVRDIEEMEIRIPPDFVQGLHPTIPFLAEHYRLGIISDTIHTHGRGLRHLLQQQGILRYFSYFIFSDEVGASKPSLEVFRRASWGLGYGPAQVVHVGDRESNDVDGPLAVGMKAILFTGAIDRGSAQTRAHAICRTFSELPRIVGRL